MVTSISIRSVRNGYIATIVSHTDDGLNIESREEAIFTESDQIKNFLDTYMRPKS
jgi:hypothetical protein